MIPWPGAWPNSCSASTDSSNSLLVAAKTLPGQIDKIGVTVYGYSLWQAGRLQILFDTFYWPGVLFSGLVLGLVIAPLGLFVNRLSRFYGDISYSLYLNHPTLVLVLIPVYRAIYARPWPVTLQYAACLLLTLGLLTILSYLTYRLIERPGMRLGSWLAKKVTATSNVNV